MIILGIILFVIGLLIPQAILTTIGGVLIVGGLVMVVLGFAGRKIAGRSHWY